jgi:hypothetical protein
MLIDDISQVKRLMISRLPMERRRAPSFLVADTASLPQADFFPAGVRGGDSPRKSALTQVQSRVILSLKLQR